MLHKKKYLHYITYFINHIEQQKRKYKKKRRQTKK